MINGQAAYTSLNRGPTGILREIPSVSREKDKHVEGQVERWARHELDVKF